MLGMNLLTLGLLAGGREVSRAAELEFEFSCAQLHCPPAGTSFEFFKLWYEGKCQTETSRDNSITNPQAPGSQFSAMVNSRSSYFIYALTHLPLLRWF